MTRRRALLALGVVVSSFVLTACGLLFDFNDYDTTLPVLDAAFGEGSAEDGGSFDLIITGALTIEPGADATLLPVTIQRHGDGNARVDVGVTATPAGISPILTASIEPGGSSTSLSIGVLAATPAAVVTLHVVATEGALTRTKDVVLTLRGAPCTRDRGFGIEGVGVVHVTALQPQAQDQGFFIAAGDGGATIGSVDTTPAYTRAQVHQLDGSGNVIWLQIIDTPLAVVTVGSSGEVFAAVGDSVTRIMPDGGVDRTFGSAGVAPSCLPAALAATAISGLALLCEPGATASGNWSLAELAPNGAASSGPADAPFAPPAGGGQALHITGAGFVACGLARDAAGRHAAFSRWAFDGGVDPSFGVGGVLELGTDTDVNDCIADDAGVVSIGVVDGGVALLGLSAAGQPDQGFGEAGAQRFELPDGAPDPVVPRLVSSGSSVLALLEPLGGTALLARFDRSTGALDTSFGENGYCALEPLGLGAAAAIAVTADGKVMVLANGYGDLIVGRLWL